MPARSIHHRKRRSAAQFGAPWGRQVKLGTAIGGGVMVAVILVPQLAQVTGRVGSAWVRWLVPTLLLAVFAVVSLFNVRGFTVQGRELLIQRSFWETRFSLNELKEAHADSAAMKGSVRLVGNGGFLAFTGWFRSKKLGKYRAFVTDPARCVVMEFKDRKLVVSPDDPEGFVRALGFEPEPNRSRG